MFKSLKRLSRKVRQQPKEQFDREERRSKAVKEPGHVNRCKGLVLIDPSGCTVEGRCLQGKSGRIVVGLAADMTFSLVRAITFLDDEKKSPQLLLSLF